MENNFVYYFHWCNVNLHALSIIYFLKVFFFQYRSLGIIVPHATGWDWFPKIPILFWTIILFRFRHQYCFSLWALFFFCSFSFLLLSVSLSLSSLYFLLPYTPIPFFWKLFVFDRNLWNYTTENNYFASILANWSYNSLLMIIIIKYLKLYN